MELNPQTSASQSATIASVTSSLQSAILSVGGPTSAHTSFSSSSLSSASASSSSHGSLAALKKEHDDKAKSKTGGEVRSLTNDEIESAVDIASPTLTTAISGIVRDQMHEIKSAIESAINKMGKNVDLKALIHAFVEIEFEKSWEIGILTKYKNACDHITSIGSKSPEMSFDNKVFQAAQIHNLEPYKLKFLYEEMKKSSTSSSFPPSPSQRLHSSSTHSSDSALEAAIKEVKDLMGTEQKGKGMVTEADIETIASRHSVNYITLMGALGFTK